jgi:hypothetical protein
MAVKRRDLPTPPVTNPVINEHLRPCLNGSLCLNANLFFSRHPVQPISPLDIVQSLVPGVVREGASTAAMLGNSETINVQKLIVDCPQVLVSLSDLQRSCCIPVQWVPIVQCEEGPGGNIPGDVQAVAAVWDAGRFNLETIADGKQCCD